MSFKHSEEQNTKHTKGHQLSHSGAKAAELVVLPLKSHLKRENISERLGLERERIWEMSKATYTVFELVQLLAQCQHKVVGHVQTLP